MNLLRSFTKGGFADLSRVHQWNQEFVAASPAGKRYEELAAGIDRALRFMQACGISTETQPDLHAVDFYTSHEALILGYEEPLTRLDSLTGEWYDCSAHMLWIGERTRQLDGAHMAFLAGVRNPIGCKIGPTVSPDEAVGICERLNPDREPGRLTLITRMGAEQVDDRLPPLLEAVRDSGHPVVWACDPMHGNTYTTENGTKTRHFDAILRGDRRVLPGPRCGWYLAGRRALRAHRRRCHRMPGRSPGPGRRRPDHTIRDRVRPPAQRPPVAGSRLPGGRAAASPVAGPKGPAGWRFAPGRAPWEFSNLELRSVSTRRSSKTAGGPAESGSGRPTLLGSAVLHRPKRVHHEHSSGRPRCRRTAAARQAGSTDSGFGSSSRLSALPPSAWERRYLPVEPSTTTRV